MNYGEYSLRLTGTWGLLTGNAAWTLGMKQDIPVTQRSKDTTKV